MIAGAFNAITSLFSTSDEQAMWRVAMQDDGQAFAQLVARWEDPIRRLAERMTGDPHRAEDLAQEAFARVYARRKDYQPASKFSTWLWRISLNLCHDDMRRRYRRGEVPLDDEFSDPGPGVQIFASEDPAPDVSLVENERHALVRSALQCLPESFRAVVVLKHYEGLKFREIADILDIPEGTVKSRMAESLTQLQRHLAPSLAEPAPRRQPRARRAAPSENFVL
jgi:RNA polymerase sigma-70 factor (ECF subfamily)